MKTFRQFLEQKRLTELNQVDTLTYRNTMNALAGGPTPATNLTQTARAGARKDMALAIATAGLPEVEDAKAKSDKITKQRQPNQPAPVVAPNTGLSNPSGGVAV